MEDTGKKKGTPANLLAEQIRGARGRVIPLNRQLEGQEGILVVITTIHETVLSIWTKAREPLQQVTLLEMAAKKGMPEATARATAIREEKLNKALKLASDLEEQRLLQFKGLQKLLLPLNGLESQGVVMVEAAQEKIREASKKATEARKKKEGARNAMTKLDIEIRRLARVAENGTLRADTDKTLSEAMEKVEKLQNQISLLSKAKEKGMEEAAQVLPQLREQLEQAQEHQKAATADHAAVLIEKYRARISELESEIREADAEASEAKMTADATRSEIEWLEEEMRLLRALRARVAGAHKKWEQMYRDRLRLERSAKYGWALPKELPCSKCNNQKRHPIGEMWHGHIPNLWKVIRGNGQAGDPLSEETAVTNMVRFFRQQDSTDPKVFHVCSCDKHKPVDQPGRILDTVWDAPELCGKLELQYAESSRRHRRAEEDKKGRTKIADETKDIWLEPTTSTAAPKQAPTEHPVVEAARLDKLLQEVLPYIDEMGIGLFSKPDISWLIKQEGMLSEAELRARALEERAKAIAAHQDAVIAELRARQERNFAEQDLVNAEISALQAQVTNPGSNRRQQLEAAGKLNKAELHLEGLLEDSLSLDARIKEANGRSTNAAATWRTAVANVEQISAVSSAKVAAAANIVADQLEIAASPPPQHQPTEHQGRRIKVSVKERQLRAQTEKKQVRRSQSLGGSQVRS